MYPEKRWNFSRQFQAIWRESWLSFGRQKVWKWRFFCMRRTPGSISQSAFKGKVNVSSIAQYFGGGGHVRAAGVTMKGSAHDVINNLLRQNYIAAKRGIRRERQELLWIMEF